MKRLFENLSWQIIFAAFLLIFFLRNLLMPFVADDYSYAFIWDGADKGNLVNGLDTSRLQPVKSFADILESQWQHYFTWGGRTIAHIFVQFFIWQEKIFFDAANVLVMAALIFLLFKVATGLSLCEMKKSYLLLILAGLYFCAPAFLISAIWLTGSCNYLWMCTLEILFLLPFALKYWRKDFWADSSTGKIILMSILGLIAGWSIEPGAAVTVFVTFLFCVYFCKERNFQSWMKAGFIFLLAGFAILILAPGNFHKMDLAQDYLPPSAIQMVATNFVGGFLPVFLREIILFVPIIFYFVKAKTSPKVSRFILGFSAASILNLVVMLFSPFFPERAGFPSTIFLLIASLAAFKEILPSVENFFARRIKILIVFVVFWAIHLSGCLYVEYNFCNQFEERINFAVAHKNAELIIVPAIHLPNWSETFLGSRTWDKFALLGGADLRTKETNSRNLIFAKYYGLKKIVRKNI